ncbi:MAG: hypothetical protein NDI77_05075 [Geobacteraceae bacterium]|nr:hypothetical protein [Geobacteraceae bacterium]
MKKAILTSVILLLASAPAFVLATAPIPAIAPNAHLYHSDAGLVCSDCHVPSGAALKKKNITDLCLSCHAEGHNTSATADLPDVENSGWTAPVVMTATGVRPSGMAMPAGDFYWSNQDSGLGHNPAYAKGATVADSNAMQADPVLGNRPPGGTISDGEWTCHSCHGSHSRFDAENSAWRQLRRRVNGKNITGNVSAFGVESTSGNVTQDPDYEPIKSNSRGDMQGGNYVSMRKDGNPLEGADLFRAEGDGNKNVYRGGFSSFCSACHGNFHGGNNETGSIDNGISRVGGAWVKHPSNMRLGDSAKYGATAYTAAVSNMQRTNPNPAGYDWKYPLVKADYDFTVKSVEASASATTVSGDDRIMCLTCHKAHATQFRNMTRWDVKAHSFIASGESDFAGEPSNGDNPAYGCGKCHQMGGTVAFVKAF